MEDERVGGDRAVVGEGRMRRRSVDKSGLMVELSSRSTQKKRVRQQERDRESRIIGK